MITLLVRFGVRHFELDFQRFCIDWEVNFRIAFDDDRTRMIGTLDTSDKYVR
mgnify:CR=1 FL=1